MFLIPFTFVLQIELAELLCHSELFCNFMKGKQLLTLLSIFGLVACNNPEKEKLILNKVTFPVQKGKYEAPKIAEIKKPITTKKDSTSLFSIRKQKKQKRVQKSEEVDLSIEGFKREEQNFILPGFVKNTFIKNGNSYYFKRVVKQEEDRRVGCSGGENELSFTVTIPADTFVIENEMLKSLNFKYRINGGLLWEDGENPYKGKIIGILLQDGSWQIEINVWIKMKDIQLSKEIEKQLIIKDKFTL